MKCALCKEKGCYQGKNCVQDTQKFDNVSEEDFKIMKVAAEIEGDFYCQKTRLEEIIEFGKRMGYKRMGIAFCIGSQSEGAVVHKVLAQHFEVDSVCCKVCGVNKKDYNLTQIRKGNDYEASCHPLMQAQILNEAGTDLNIIVGLCVGHDVLFTQHSKAPVITFIAKDRVLAHNTAGAIYSGYYKNKFDLKE